MILLLACAWLPVAAGAAQTRAEVDCTRINVVGDSLTWVGERALRSALSEVGWASAVIDAYPSRSIFYKAPADRHTGLDAVDDVRRDHGDSPCWIVALGTNDVGLWPTSEYAAVIRSMLDRIGDDHRVLWVNVYKGTRPDWQVAWTTSLNAVAAERPSELLVLDWASNVATHPEWLLTDGTHYTSDGYRARAREIATASLQLRPSTRTPAERVAAASMPLSPSGPPGRLVPIGPSRVLDSRATQTLHPGASYPVALAGIVPSGSIAVAANITAVHSAAPGYLAAFACGEPTPPTSTLNFNGQRDASSLALIGLDGAGALCLSVSTETHVIVDVTAAFTRTSGSGLIPSEPERLLDTRGGAPVAPGGPRSVFVGTAVAAWLNITAIGAAGSGYLTAFPCGQPTPPTSTVNFIRGSDPIANAAVIPVGADGTICIHTSMATHVVVDVTGRFSSTTGLAYQPAPPTRLLDTRVGIGGWQGRLADEQTIEFPVAISSQVADSVAVGTLTAIDAATAGYLTVWGGPTMPATSNLNYGPQAVIANLVASARGPDGSVRIFTSGRPGALAFDLVGWFSA